MEENIQLMVGPFLLAAAFLRYRERDDRLLEQRRNELVVHLPHRIGLELVLNSRISPQQYHKAAEAVKAMVPGGPSLTDVETSLIKLEGEVFGDILAGRFSASERQRTVGFLKSSEGKQFLTFLPGFHHRYTVWDEWLGENGPNEREEQLKVERAIKEAKERTSKAMVEAMVLLPKLRILGLPTYVGGMLAKLLPYRKQNILFGPKVCEMAALKPMCKAGFLLGCCVTLWDIGEAALALEEEAAPNPNWGDAFMPAMNYFWVSHQRLSMWSGDLLSQEAFRDEPTYEMLFPEGGISFGPTDKVLLQPEECQARIALHVLCGLLYGVSHMGRLDDSASLLVQAWISEGRGWQRLGVGGLSVYGSPGFTSIEEALKHAEDIYRTWRLYEEVSKDAEDTISRLRQNPWFRQH